LSLPKRSAILAVALGVACLSPSVVSARTQSASSTPQPLPQMQSLVKAIGGKWSVAYKFEPDGSNPKGSIAEGEEVWRTGPGGFTLMEEEHFRTPQGEVFLFALHWWDKSTNSFRGMLCNNSGPAACNVDTYYHSSLKWDGKQFVIDLEFPQGAKNMLWHEAISDFTPTSFTQTGDMGEVGGPLRCVVTAQAKKFAD